jgi:serine/threonine-protein kinase HipA
VDRSLEPFFLQGSGLGGARPKTLIEHDNRQWIAKFGREADLVDMCRVECASMSG